MVVTNVGGLHEVVPDGKTGFVTTPDATSIADAILKFYQPNSLPNLHENILQEKKKYSWETFVAKMLQIVSL
jgi:glycosyltransferase involved in cell wall biosynthesis